jgi:hypothetical protein
MPKPHLAAKARLTRFLRAEDGVLTVLGLLFFVAMLLCAGVALDMIRSEVDRARLQSSIDRAVLAATTLQETGDAREIAESYLRADGVDLRRVTITAQTDVDSRRVEIETVSLTPTYFMSALGHDVLVNPVSSRAEQELTELEVSLVLDTSGSMSGAKTAALKAAAQEFVQTLLESSAVETSISVVPYNTRVNVGAELASHLNMTVQHTLSACAMFPSTADYETVALDPAAEIERMAHFNRTWNHNWNNPGVEADANCPTDDHEAILPWSNDVGALRAMIGGIGADGSTAIPLGAKWGLALLDPSTRPVAEAILARQQAAAADASLPRPTLSFDAELAGRPYAYDRAGSLKALVLMTDGMNRYQRDIAADRKHGPSGVFVHRSDLTVPVLGNGGAFGIDDIDGDSRWSASWAATRGQSQDWAAQGGAYAGYPWWDDADRRNWTAWDGQGTAADGSTTTPRYSVWSEERDQFWIPHLKRYQAEPFGGTDAIELGFAEFWAAFSSRHIGQRLLKTSDGLDRATYNYYAKAVVDMENPASQDADLARVCAAARDRGIVIFTIAFQAPAGAQRVLQNCSDGSSGFHQNVESLDIGSAFDDIISSITRLRLTQ